LYLVDFTIVSSVVSNTIAVSLKSSIDYKATIINIVDRLEDSRLELLVTVSIVDSNIDFIDSNRVNRLTTSMRFCYLGHRIIELLEVLATTLNLLFEGLSITVL
jgi:hypothetical protein